MHTTDSKKFHETLSKQKKNFSRAYKANRPIQTRVQSLLLLAHVYPGGQQTFEGKRTAALASGLSLIKVTSIGIHAFQVGTNFSKLSQLFEAMPEATACRGDIWSKPFMAESSNVGKNCKRV